MTELSKPSVPLTAAKGLPVVAVVHDSGTPVSMVLFDETKKVMLKRYVRSERDHGPQLFAADGHQSRDFIYVDNVIQGNLLAAEAPDAPGKIFNMGQGRQTSLLQLLSLLSDLLDKSVQPRFDPARSGDVRESMADISQARSILGFEPKTSLEDGLRHTIDYYRQMVEAKLSSV